jgi:PII-like signaling protein
MQGTFLKFYVYEQRKHKREPVYEWLLGKAKEIGIQGGSAFRSIAGYGRHGVLHQQRFVELSADLTVEVEFVVGEEQSEQLLEAIRREGIHIVYAKVPAEFGVIDGES